MQIRVVHWAFGTVLVVTIAIVSVITDFSNHYATHMLAMNNAKWRIMDTFFASESFRALPDDCIVFAPSLGDAAFNPYYRISDYSGGHLIPESDIARPYWTKYGEVKTGRSIPLVMSIDAVFRIKKASAQGVPDVYALRYACDPKIIRHYLILAKIDPVHPHRADGFHLLTPPADRPAYIHFTTAQGDATTIPVETASNAKGAFVDIPVHDENIDLRTVTVSYF